jgi:hypothetical protein
LESLRDTVKELIDQGVPTLVLMEDLEQIQGLASVADGDNILEVMDLVVGHCRPMVRIGTYAWSHPRNGYRYRFRDHDNLESTDNKGVR